MGIDAHARSAVGPKKLFGRAKGKDALRKVLKSAMAWAEANDLAPFFRSQMEGEGALWVSILPTAGRISFNFFEDGLSIDFRSSNCGPGYHSSVLDLLDYLEQDLDLSWDWGKNPDDSGDETEFAFARDFDDLQNRMARFLKLLSGSAVANQMETGALCVPMGLGQREGKIACPLGFRDFAYLSRIAELEGEELKTAAASWFVWWSKEKSAEFWEHLLRAFLWQDVNWRQPSDSAEAGAMIQIDAIVQRLQSAGGVMPSDLSHAVEEYRLICDEGGFPAPDGIGYRRGFVRQSFFPGWSVAMPGYYRQTTDEDGSTVVFSFADNSARFSSVSADVSPGWEYDWPASFADAPLSHGNGFEWKRSSVDIYDDGMASQTTVLVATPDRELQMLLITLTAAEKHLDLVDDWVDQITFNPAGL